MTGDSNPWHELPLFPSPLVSRLSSFNAKASHHHIHILFNDIQHQMCLSLPQYIKKQRSTLYTYLVVPRGISLSDCTKTSRCRRIRRDNPNVTMTIAESQASVLSKLPAPFFIMSAVRFLPHTVVLRKETSYLPLKCLRRLLPFLQYFPIHSQFA